MELTFSIQQLIPNINKNKKNKRFKKKQQGFEEYFTSIFFVGSELRAHYFMLV